MIKFSIGGRPVDPRNMKDALMRAVLENVRAQIKEKVGAIRDPDTGEFPTVIVRGESIDKLALHVEGSPKLVALVRERLGMEAEGQVAETAVPSAPPRVFLSYTSDNLELARRIAEALEAKGIETWWDKWCIYPGDSLRRKIDEGIAGCTHFLVLLTSESIGKPWVNQEMDAGLVRKLNDQCKFFPIRYDLPSSALPPLLSGMHSPAITTDEDIVQLINDVYGVNRRPPRGTPPIAIARSSGATTSYSPAATSIARLFVERTKHALFADPQFDVVDLAKETGLSVEDTKDALYELSGFVKLSLDHVLVQGALFSEFDRHWKPWDPAEDALRLAADIVNDPEFPADPRQIAEHYDWEPRRLNPVVHFLLERRLIVDRQVLNSSPFAIASIVGNEHIRRFVKRRS
jgi:TIR domain